MAVLEGVFPTLPEFWKHYPVAHAVLQASKIVVPKFNRELNPLRKSAQIQQQPSILLMYSESDIYTPPVFGHRLKEVLESHTSVELHTVANAEHTHIYRDQPEQYQTRVLPFLAQHLL